MSATEDHVPDVERERRRVLVTEDGPVLVQGPVELTLPDGSVVHADRPMVAVCACTRSARYPLCDTSHRRRRRPVKELG